MRDESDTSLHHQNVGEVDARGLDRDHDLALARNRRRDLGDSEAFERAEFPRRVALP